MDFFQPFFFGLDFQITWLFCLFFAFLGIFFGFLISLFVWLICMAYLFGLFVWLICLAYLFGLFVWLICLAYFWLIFGFSLSFYSLIFKLIRWLIFGLFIIIWL
jgi:hypothetical protein